jgi:peptidoglycan/LPS O-acetylase OafA/YrhL
MDCDLSYNYSFSMRTFSVSKSIKYRPDIDGLRAIAVLSVMLSHIGFTTFSGGYVGVDVFFVISGYLITSIIYVEVTQEKFLFKIFYERRARRILPALYFVVLLCFIPSWLLLIPQDFIDFSETVIGTVFFSSNLVLWLQSGYFDQAAELKPLLHTWSLAVEEQYYVFFPILVLIIYKTKKLNLLASIILLLVISLILSHWAAFNKPTANYYLLPTRAWELLVGSTVALLTYQKGSSTIKRLWLTSVGKLAPIIGLLMIVVPIFTFDKFTPFPSLWAILPTFGTALIIFFGRPDTLTFKILSNRIFVGIGLISYSAYLWHQPIYAFMRVQDIIEINLFSMFGAIFCSLIAAFLTWKYIEQPFRNKDKWSTNKIWGFSVIGGLLLCSMAVIIILNKGFTERFELRSPLTSANFDLAKKSNGWCFYSIDTNDALLVGSEGINCVIGAQDKKPRILFFGDSYAGMYEPFWDTIGKEYSFSVNAVTTNWCFPSVTNSFWWPSPTLAYDQCMFNRKYLAAALGNYDAIAISGVWTILEQNNIFKEVIELIELAERQNVKVIIMPHPPMLTRSSVINASHKELALRYDYESEEAAKRQNTVLQDIAKNSQNVIFIKRDSLFKNTKTGELTLSDDNVPYSLDGGHISIYGSKKAAENFLKSKQSKELHQFINNAP